MKTLGVTGGIGSGKSTVCRLFKDLGARVFVADDVAKRLMQQDPTVRREIVDAFGPESYDAEGRLDRAYLAQQVFGDEENVARINAIVHPRVFEAFRQVAREAAQEGVELLVHEAALIFEAGGDRHLDAVAVVDAPEAVRVRRVVERDGVAPEQVRARMQHQLPPEELRRRADFVIDNAGNEEALRSQVQAVYDAMVTSEAESSPDD
jgi:dephospho-CoA kinase